MMVFMLLRAPRTRLQKQILDKKQHKSIFAIHELLTTQFDHIVIHMSSNNAQPNGLGDEMQFNAAKYAIMLDSDDFYIERQFVLIITRIIFGVQLAHEKLQASCFRLSSRRARPSSDNSMCKKKRFAASTTKRTIRTLLVTTRKTCLKLAPSSPATNSSALS